MISNVFVFAGEEKYLLWQELLRWKSNFVQKYGQDSLFVFDSEKRDFGLIKQSIYEGGLFVSKKLVILFGLPFDTDADNKLSAATGSAFVDDFLAKEGQMPADTLLVFVSYKPDKRSKLWKFLETNTQVKMFDKLRSPELKQFVREQSPGLLWTDESLEYFLNKVGDDMFHVVHELDKLATWCEVHADKTVSLKLIDSINFGLVEANNFAIFDLLMRDVPAALCLIDEVKRQGTHWTMFMGSLYWGVKLWIFVLEAWDQGMHDSKQIASAIKAPPFSLSPMIKHIDRLQARREAIFGLYRGMVELDAGIKSGTISDVFFWLSLKQLVLRCFV